MEELKFWHDKDLGPYVKGENPEIDKIVEELTEKLLEYVKNRKEEPK
ncbi:MAG: hypothetical protein NC299_11700 [Lachnospiraceae bacterium]|nr:hypothetical protein [Ruminococcus sp.]MCM1276006.1 hypothetical protein [Lachnospiraceae bacterium]